GAVEHGAERDLVRIDRAEADGIAVLPQGALRVVANAALVAELRRVDQELVALAGIHLDLVGVGDQLAARDAEGLLGHGDGRARDGVAGVTARAGRAIRRARARGRPRGSLP